MEKLIFPFFLVTFFYFQCTGKAQTDIHEKSTKALFVEAFGQGLHASVNYDMRLKKGVQDGIGFRVGIGGISTGTDDADAGLELNGVVAFPVGINYLIGEKRSAFEVGIGLMPLKASTPLHSPTKPKIINENGWGRKGFLNIGYRFQPINNGFVFRFNWTPVFGDIGFVSRFGISAGFGFK